MAEENLKIKQVIVEQQLKEAYLDYSMSVIVGRALPDVRDGLKPVHRRILFAMNEMGLHYNKPFKKSARIVGECLGKYHPHGDLAIYESLVRMAQEFNLRYPLIHGQGNFGCFTGDTKIKLMNGTSKSFKELCEIYKKYQIFYVYSVDKNGNVVVGEATNPRLTKKEAQLVEVTLDTGDKIRCTPDHKFLLNNLEYKEAKDLTSEDSLMPGYFQLSPIRGNTELKEYLMIKDNKKDKYIFVHEITDNYNLDKGVYNSADGPVRHHVDFNKFNNNPNNLKRIGWNEHTKIHNDHIKSLWKNEEFRKKQSEGLKNFYKNNPEHLEKLRIRTIERNKNKEFIKKQAIKRKEIWKSPELKQSLSNKIRNNFAEHPERKQFISQISKEMWSDHKKRNSIIKSIKEYYSKNPSIGEIRSENLKSFYNKNPEAKKLISKRSKEFWNKNEYKSKFINNEYNHFSNIAKKAWQNNEYRELQSKKCSKQWEDKYFRNKIINSIKINNEKKLRIDPDYPKRLAQKAAVAHRINWKNPDYKKNIIKNKVLYYTNRLISTLGENNINMETYNKNRTNNCFPRFENAIKYFKDVNEMISLAKKYNHYAVNVKFLDYKEDVYDITVNEHHNFLLDSGIFVHNSTEFGAAASRYTEAKLSKISQELLEDIEKETVSFTPNFDNSLQEPLVLPSKIPNLLLNGSSGIAVGMTTNIPPHNINEVCDATILLLENEEAELNKLLELVKGPDFPTGAQIIGTEGIKQAYKTGKGRVVIRAKATIEKDTIIVNEIPYQVNKSTLIEQIADLVKDKIIEGISDIRDESDREGLRIVIDLKKGANPELILNQLYKNSQLQTTFGIINLALVNNEPKILSLKEMILEFIHHRKEIIVKRTKYDLRKAEERDHVLQGLLIALSQIDSVISLIRKSKDVEEARLGLISNFSLTEIQANAILEMKLSRLAALEQKKILDEHNELLKFIQEMKDILASEVRVRGIIKDELIGLKNIYGDKRRTGIIQGGEEVIDEDLIEEEQVVITATHSGYVKRQALDVYQAQRRGGKGIIGTETRDENDFVEHLFIASTHSYILIFTDYGMVHWLKAYQIPESGRYAKGIAIVNLVKLSSDEKLASMVSVDKFEENKFLVMATKNGVVKKTQLSEYGNPRQGGIIAINLRENDKLIGVDVTDGTKQIILATRDGRAVRFKESDVNVVGRNSIGVRGINVKKSEVIGMEIVRSPYILTVTENGYGKRSKVEDYRLINRGGSGVTNVKITEKNGKVVSIKVVDENDEIMLISKNGIIIRTTVKSISCVGRNSQGVRVMNLEEGDKLATVAVIIGENGNLEIQKEEYKPSENENNITQEINEYEPADEDLEENNLEREQNEVSKEENHENIKEIEVKNDIELTEEEVKKFLEENNSEEKKQKKDFTLDGYE